MSDLLVTRPTAAVALTAALAMAGSGCTSNTTADKTGSSTTERSAGCTGAATNQANQAYDPRILRGRLLAPSGKLADNLWAPDWLIPSAHAAPLNGEQTVPQASVRLYRVDSTGRQTGGVLRKTTTNMTGKWCMKLPEGVQFGADLMVAAGADDARLRRSVVANFTTDIYSTTEALTALLIARGVDFTTLPKSSYLNMEAIADTRVDLLEPVELSRQDTVGQSVAKIRHSLADDPRLTAKLDHLEALADKN